MDMLEFFLKKEQELNMLEKKIDSFYYWRYIRIEWWHQINRSGVGTFHKKRKFSNYKEQIFLLVSNCIHTLKLKKYKNVDIVVITHQRRSKNEEGKYECLYTDCLSKELKNVITIEFPFQKCKHFNPSSIENIYYMDYSHIKSYIYKMFYQALKKTHLKQVKNTLYEEIEKFYKEIAKEYKIECSIERIVAISIEYYILYQVREKEYRKLLNKWNPKIIVETVSYDFDKMIINEVATKFGIKTIELQHGVINDKNLAYNYLTDKKIDQFPQFLFVFSEFWMRDIRLPISKEKIIPVGYPYLERQTKKYVKDNYKHKKTILFISQPIIGRELSIIARELANHIDHCKYHIIYKLHPLEFETWRIEYPNLECETIEIIEKNGKNLYQCFSESKYQIGVFSAAIYEGLAYSLETYLYKINGIEHVSYLINNKVATVFSNTNELIEYINESEKKDTNETISELFWKSNASQNMLAKINELL